MITIGRLFMLAVWGFLIFNLLHPFPSPLKHFLNIALIFMVMMHGLQMLLLKATLAKIEPKLSAKQQWKIFLFGVFELLDWQKKQRNHPHQ